ncbi:MAG TPA: PTS lactose/cellobiose transporter subunit IIA [Firmicutes bacterium]|nr:PTS lactose/cellobiose transporter subunit IIA [Bacillota bacterium]
MEEKIMEISFNIIATAGDAKNLAMEAIRESKQGNVDAAKDLLQQSRQGLVNAHKFQTQLITAEASGEKTAMSVILVHAQDHLMTSMTFQQLAEEIVELYGKMDQK